MTFDEFIKFNVRKAKLLVHKICRYEVTGQGHGMPCPCENMASQHIDIERKNSILIRSFSVTPAKAGDKNGLKKIDYEHETPLLGLSPECRRRSFAIVLNGE